jgi:hypothetical protein
MRAITDCDNASAKFIRQQSLVAAFTFAKGRWPFFQRLVGGVESMKSRKRKGSSALRQRSFSISGECVPCHSGVVLMSLVGFRGLGRVT